VPQRLQDITAPNSDHFQHVGQQTFMTTAHSHQPDATGRSPSVDGAETVTGSAQIGAVRQAAWDRRSISHSIPTIDGPRLCARARRLPRCARRSAAPR
jgi:hypothetical protein